MRPCAHEMHVRPRTQGVEVDVVMRAKRGLQGNICWREMWPSTGFIPREVCVAMHGDQEEGYRIGPSRPHFSIFGPNGMAQQVIYSRKGWGAGQLSHTQAACTHAQIGAYE